MCAAIVVNLHARTVRIRVGEIATHLWPCAIGRLDESGRSYTPKGMFRVIEKDAHEPFVSEPRYGTRILRLDKVLNGKHVCIHGTDEPGLIGKAVSGACIRMRNADVEELYRLVPVGTQVIVE